MLPIYLGKPGGQFYDLHPLTTMANFSFVNFTPANIDSGSKKRSRSPVLSEMDTKRSRSVDTISANDDVYGK